MFYFMVHSYGLDAAISFVFLGLFGEQWSFVLTPHSMHGRHPHPSSPSLFLSLAAVLLPHPHERNLVDLAAHHVHVQLASTGTPKAARLHARVLCMQAAPSLIFLLRTWCQQGPCSSPAAITRSSQGTAAAAHLSMVLPALGASIWRGYPGGGTGHKHQAQALKKMMPWA